MTSRLLIVILLFVTVRCGTQQDTSNQPSSTNAEPGQAEADMNAFAEFHRTNIATGKLKPLTNSLQLAAIKKEMGVELKEPITHFKNAGLVSGGTTYARVLLGDTTNFYAVLYQYEFLTTPQVLGTAIVTISKYGQVISTQDIATWIKASPQSSSHKAYGVVNPNQTFLTGCEWVAPDPNDGSKKKEGTFRIAGRINQDGTISGVPGGEAVTNITEGKGSHPMNDIVSRYKNDLHTNKEFPLWRENDLSLFIPEYVPPDGPRFMWMCQPMAGGFLMGAGVNVQGGGKNFYTVWVHDDIGSTAVWSQNFPVLPVVTITHDHFVKITIPLPGYADFVTYHVLNGSDFIDLAETPTSDCRINRNWIFARLGYQFESNDLQQYFLQFSWYKPQYQNVDNKLTADDREIIRILKEKEDQPEPEESEDSEESGEEGESEG